MFMYVCEIVATVATMATLCCFLDRWLTIVFNVYADMRESLLRNLLFQAHAELESVDESLPVVLPAQVIHSVNDCVYTLCG